MKLSTRYNFMAPKSINGLFLKQKLHKKFSSSFTFYSRANTLSETKSRIKIYLIQMPKSTCFDQKNHIFDSSPRPT
jgi:hypothetical protein